MSYARVLSIQFAPELGNKTANCNKIIDIIKQNSQNVLDLVVLPEFFSTGIDAQSFLNEPEHQDDSFTLNFFKKVALELNVNIVMGTIAEKADDGKLYNTSFAINRQGEIIGKYRKIHLFDYLGGEEGKKFNAGNTPVVVQFDFAKVGLSICFDIRYPLLYNKLIKMGAEIIVLPSAWCYLNDIDDNSLKSFMAAWESLNVARSVETQTYFISANLSGKINDNVSCIGKSMIVAPDGTILKQAKNNEFAICKSIGLGEIRDLKRDFPVFDID